MKTEIISEKIETNVVFKSKEVRENYVSVALDKENVENLFAEITFALAWALNQAGIDGLDITIRENQSEYEVILEK